MIPEHDEIVGSEPDDVQHRTAWVCPECGRVEADADRREGKP